jgi:pilus assembly protein Flp/PilA
VGAIRKCLRLLGNERGATALEYGLIAALIVIAIMGSLSLLGGGANGLWGKVSSKVDAAMNP